MNKIIDEIVSNKTLEKINKRLIKILNIFEDKD